MANLLVTTACNADCHFCFARGFMDQETSGSMELGRYHRLLELIRSSGGTEVRLAGGEPTLHPDFAAMVTAASTCGMRVTVLSNGLMPEPALARLEQLPEESCSVLLNYRSEPVSAADRRRLVEVLERLGARVVLGCTIDRIPYDFEPILAILGEHRQLGRFLRVGMAHPSLGWPAQRGSSAHRHLVAKQYPAVGRLLARLAHRLTRLGVTMVFDCGFVRCQLDDEAVAALADNQAQTRFECRPIVDLGPGDQAVHCLATATRFKMALNGTLQSLRQGLAARRRAYDQIGIYRECSGCTWRIGGDCDGGCLVHRLARLRPVAPQPIPEEVVT